jgi:hypothetical protein
MELDVENKGIKRIQIELEDSREKNHGFYDFAL